MKEITILIVLFVLRFVLSLKGLELNKENLLYGNSIKILEQIPWKE
jgi:hypothetical protein